LSSEINSSISGENKALRIVGLDKSYKRYPWVSGGDVRALKNFFFSAEQGSIVAILGHNGGKILQES
jgi:ABC-type multidrug transport system ATPase subunit